MVKKTEESNKNLELSQDYLEKRLGHTRSVKKQAEQALQQIIGQEQLLVELLKQYEPKKYARESNS